MKLPTNKTKIIDPRANPNEYIDFFMKMIDVPPKFKRLVVTDVGKLCGFAFGFIGEQEPVFINDRNGNIQGLYVQPEYRRNGYGEAMIDDLLDWFDMHSAQEIYCNVMAGNEASLALFKKKGFDIDHLKLRKE